MSSSLALLFALLGVASACLITNCPRGGKRSSSIDRPRPASCVPCGRGDEGVCMGPGVCCAPRSGCVLSVHGPCLQATSFPPTCLTDSRTALVTTTLLSTPCGADLTPDGSAPGTCAADGVCCTRDSCRIDPVCSVQENDVPSPVFDREILKALRRVAVSPRDRQ